MTKNDRTFMEITNKDIYTEMKAFHERYEKDHLAIISRLDVTNGKVKLSRWLATTAMTLSFLFAGWLVSHLAG